MFESALGVGGDLVMLVTFEGSIASMEQEFVGMKAARGSDASLRTVLVEGAREAIDRGDAETHNRLIAKAAAGVGACSAMLLAHFSDGSRTGRCGGKSQFSCSFAAIRIRHAIVQGALTRRYEFDLMLSLSKHE